MKKLKVNGVVVNCSNCVNYRVSPLDDPCKDCWKVIFHSDDVSASLEDIAFYPADKDRFLILENLVKKYKEFMQTDAENFSFRFLSGLEKKEYPVDIWNELRADQEIDVHTFRIGDFFVYATFNYADKHARVTLGDMWQQQHNDYKDGYSNIIIHPDGRVAVNWQ